MDLRIRSMVRAREMRGNPTSIFTRGGGGGVTTRNREREKEREKMFDGSAG